MKHTTLIALAFLFAASVSACVKPAEPDDNTNGRPLAQEGEFCGGIAAFQCAPGLTCAYDGTYPDAGGTCVKQ